MPPVNPGATVIITVGSNSAVINSKRQPFNDATVLFKQYDSADKDLKQILLGAVDEMFVRSLQTKYVGYLNVSTRDILEHLYSKYARILADELQKNDVALKNAYDTNQPIESLFGKVEIAVNYAATGNIPYSPTQVVATAFQIFFATGMFLEDYKTWKRKTDADKTWDNFKTYFSLAHSEFLETRTTTNSVVFVAANSADSLSPHQPSATYQQETVNAITNLSSSTSHNRDSVTTLTSTVADLTTELSTTNAKLIKALVKTTKLTVTVGKLRLTTPKPHVRGQHY